jgi:hypothetical protein
LPERVMIGPDPTMAFPAAAAQDSMRCSGQARA